MTPEVAAIAFLLSGVAWNFIRLPHRLRARRTPVARSRRGPLEYATMLPTIVGSWLGFFYALVLVFLPELLPLPADYRFLPAAGWLGVALAVAAMALFYIAHRELGRAWSMSLDTRVGHQLVTSGIYARVRHPIYLAFFLWFLAQALLLPNGIAGPAGLAAFTVLYLVRVRREETMMLESFGVEYRDYMARTRRLIPGVL